MPHFRPNSEKTADDGSRVVIGLDGHHAWFVERPSDRELGAPPLGAFRSEEAARRWADRYFTGGVWSVGRRSLSV